MKQHSLKSLISFQNIDFVLYSLLMISFYLHHRINGFILMLVIIFGGIKFFAKQLNFKGYSSLFFFPFLFLLLIIGQLYTFDLKEGWTLVERNLSLLLVPIISVSILKFSLKQQQLLIYTFIISGVLAGIYCLGVNGYYAWQNNSIYTNASETHFIYNTFMHHRLTAPIGMHAVYFSLYIAFSNIYVLIQLLKPKVKVKKRFMLVILFIYFSGLLFLLKSANIAFGFTLSVLIILLYTYINSKLKTKTNTVILIISILVISIFGFLSVQSKLGHIFIPSSMSNSNMGTIGIRLSTWECTWNVIKNNWLLGTGTGDAHHELRLEYLANNFKIGSEFDYNSHNMYLQYWMGNGILAFGLFLGGIFILLKKAIKTKHILFFCFVLLFALFSITESTMRTQKGMVFFVLFSSLFYWKPNLWMINSQEK